MQTLERLDAAGLAAVLRSYRDALRLHQERINRLNVFPVPDGDTGTNMALTAQSVVDGLPELAAGPDGLAEVAQAIRHGSLMGARGNSGVILSQILRGLADVAAAAGPDGLDGAGVARALRQASEGAWKAVQHPVEGTILSVARAAAEGAEQASAGGADLVRVLDAARDAADAALERTPEQLPALAAAGVVDSGGAGLLLLLDAFLDVVADRRIDPPAPSGAAPSTPTGTPGCPGPPLVGSPAPAGTEARPAAGGRGTRYEVMYLLDAPDEAIGAFRAVWAGLGDSIVVVGGDGLYNCHIHTDDIGAAVEAALDVGRPRRIRVSDLWDEVEEERWVREAAAGPAAPPEPETPLACAVVAVCAGEGVARIFRSLGVSRVVAGGQSMNPSTAELLAAIDDAPAGELVVLPNNKNVVPVAEAAAAAATKRVEVVPTRGVPEGFAALLDYDPEAPAAANRAAMEAAAARIVAGEVSRAVRSSRCPVGPIAAGDYLGLARDGIRSVAPGLVEATCGLLDTLVDGAHHEIVTLIVGEGATPADTRRVTSWLEEHHPGVAVEVHQGGQPLYPYLLGVE